MDVHKIIAILRKTQCPKKNTIVLVFAHVSHTHKTRIQKVPVMLLSWTYHRARRKRSREEGKMGGMGWMRCIMVSTHIVTSTTQQTECAFFLFVHSLVCLFYIFTLLHSPFIHLHCLHSTQIHILDSSFCFFIPTHLSLTDSLKSNFHQVSIVLLSSLSHKPYFRTAFLSSFSQKDSPCR